MDPIYFTNANNPLIKKYSDWFKKFGANPEKPIELIVTKHAVKHSTSASIIEPLIITQHFPAILERFTQNVKFKFEQNAARGRYYKDYDWVTQKTIAWFTKLTKTFPPSIFFIQNIEMQMYTMLGDLIVKGKIPIKALNEQMARMYLSTYHNDLILQRLLKCSSFYYVFCLGTGFDPSETIKTVYKNLKQICPLAYIVKYSERNIKLGSPYILSNIF